MDKSEELPQTDRNVSTPTGKIKRVPPPQLIIIVDEASEFKRFMT